VHPKHSILNFDLLMIINNAIPGRHNTFLKHFSQDDKFLLIFIWTHH